MSAAGEVHVSDIEKVNQNLRQALEASARAIGAQYDDLYKAVGNLIKKHPRTTVPPSANNTSYTRLQSALAKGNHFCFQPSNPNNQADDGVVFLRNSGDALMWTVLLTQNTFWLNDTAVQKNRNDDMNAISAVAEWRDWVGHLPRHRHRC